MNLRPIKATSIAAKLIIMNLALVATFATMGLSINAYTTRVEQLVDRSIHRDVSRNMANAGLLRKLTGIFSTSDQLLGVFIRNERELERQGGQLLGELQIINDSNKDQPLREPLGEYAAQLSDLLDVCSRLNSAIRKVELLHRQQYAELETLEQTISDAKIALIVKGHDPTIMEQLAVLATTYHDAALGIDMLFSRTLSGVEIGDEMRKHLLTGIDDLALRYQTLTASESAIARFAPRLGKIIKEERQAMLHYFRVSDELKRQRQLLDGTKSRLINVMQNLDAELAVSTDAMRRHMQDIMANSRRDILIMASLVALLSGLAVTLFAVSTIRRPMAAINQGIQKIAGGDLETVIRLNRSDEWALIEQALNHMTAELKQSYAELERQHDHLEELVSERTRALAETQSELVKREKLAVLGQLTATVSHELRNPLGVIRSSVYYLQSRLAGGDEPSARHLARIEQHVGLCDGIVADLLEYTRGRLSEKAPGDLNLWLEGLLANFRVPAGVQLERRLGDGIPILRFDPEKMRRVVQNLLDNAIHAITPPARLEGCAAEIQPRVSITTSRRDGGVVLEIADNGCGMDRETLRQAFDPLFTTRAQGTGLGLAIVSKIVEEHGGSVQMESSPGNGTRAIVQLRAEE